jgi:transcriptional regulator with XRE-family HTH domain
MQRFGEKLCTLRKKHGLSLQRLAEQLNLSKSFTRDLEYGKRNPNAKHLLKISDFFGVPVDVLIRDELDLDVDDTSS